MFFRWMKLIAPILIIISFFLPWFSALIVTVSGFQMSVSAGNFSQLFSNIQAGNLTVDLSVSLGTKIMFYSLWLIPLLSILSLVFAVLDKPTKLINCLLSLFGFSVFLFCWGKMQFSGIFFTFSSIGMYMMILMSILLFISALADKEDYLYED